MLLHKLHRDIVKHYNINPFSNQCYLIVGDVLFESAHPDWQQPNQRTFHCRYHSNDFVFPPSIGEIVIYLNLLLTWFGHVYFNQRDSSSFPTTTRNKQSPVFVLWMSHIGVPNIRAGKREEFLQIFFPLCLWEGA